jgi:preprotein translocase subunit YajC
MVTNGTANGATGGTNMDIKKGDTATYRNGFVVRVIEIDAQTALVKVGNRVSIVETKDLKKGAR